MKMQQLLLFPEPTHRPAGLQRRSGHKPPKPKTDGRGRHSHSLAAHQEIEATLTGRRAQIVNWLRAHGPATDRQIMRGIFGAWPHADMNMVRPRVSELLDARALC